MSMMRPSSSSGVVRSTSQNATTGHVAARIPPVYRSSLAGVGVPQHANVHRLRCGCDRFQPRRRLVGRTVVDEDQLALGSQRDERGQFLDRGPEPRPLVVDRNDDRDRFPLVAPFRHRVMMPRGYRER